MSAHEISSYGEHPSPDISMQKKANVDYLEAAGDTDYTSGKQFNTDATIATEAEHNLTFKQAVWKYRKAIGWSLIISASIVMEGYDTTLMGSFFGYPSFRRKYGTYIDETNGYQISSQWQTGLNDIGAVGNIIGALMNGYFTPKYGHRKVMLAMVC